MDYVSVTSPGSDMSKPIFNYFNNYLVSLGEPTTSEGWSGRSVRNHLLKLLSEKPKTSELYIDSGGFQIIVDDIKKSRIKEYIDVYHDLCNELCDNINLIFSLDIYNKELTSVEIYNFNKYSIEKSIELVNEKQQFSDKQLFVLQSSNRYSFSNWQKLMRELNVENYYKKWAIGGLVGLKKSTNAKFSHAVPATLWLLTYQKKYNATIDQVHWLGQSSRLSFVSMALFERLYNLNMTSDSSQLVRFAPLEAKLPYMFQNLISKDFKLIKTKDEVFEHMIGQHSMGAITHKLSHRDVDTDKSEQQSYHSYTPLEYFEKFNQLHNVDFIECQSQNVYFDMAFANLVADEIIKIGIDNIISSDTLKTIHPLMSQGRIANELFNNILLFRKFKDIVNTGDIDKANEIMDTVHKQYEYYFEKRDQTQKDKDINLYSSDLDVFKEQRDIILFNLETYNNGTFLEKLQNVELIHDNIKNWETYFAQTLENILKLKRDIKNIKANDKIYNDNLIATYLHENLSSYQQFSAKDANAMIRKTLSSQLKSTSVTETEKYIKMLTTTYESNQEIYRQMFKGEYDSEIEEYNNLKIYLHILDDKIIRLEKILGELRN